MKTVGKQCKVIMRYPMVYTAYWVPIGCFHRFIHVSAQNFPVCRGLQRSRLAGSLMLPFRARRLLHREGKQKPAKSNGSLKVPGHVLNHFPIH